MPSSTTPSTAREDSRAVGQSTLVRAEPLVVEASPRSLTSSITPSRMHFVRNHFAAPRLARARHRVTVDGAVAHSFEFGAAHLKRLPSRVLAVTLECAGNNRASMVPLPLGEPWQRGAVSTAWWTGVPLAEVLAHAGVGDDVVEILVEGSDEGLFDRDGDGAGNHGPYARALPIDKAFDPDTLLAFEMNGAPLPQRHGAPLRLIVPDWYAMASVKWVRRITALRRPFDGFFQAERYVIVDGKGSARPITELAPQSMVVAPSDGGRVARGEVEVWGWAWSRHGAVASVDLSVDGDRWSEAPLTRPAAKHAWCLWRAVRNIHHRGRHTVRARARDLEGVAQPDAPSWNQLGYCNNATATVVFDVV